MAIPRSKCLECKKYLWDDIPPIQPQRGCPVICVFCGCMMEFGKKLQLTTNKKITKEMNEASSIIKFLNATKSNPFNGDPDKFNIKNLLLPSH